MIEQIAMSSDSTATPMIRVADERGAVPPENSLASSDTIARLREACALNRARARSLARRLRELQPKTTIARATSADRPAETAAAGIVNLRSYADPEHAEAQPDDAEVLTNSLEQERCDDLGDAFDLVDAAESTAETEPEEIEEITFETVKSEAPVSTADLLERFGAAVPETREDEPSLPRTPRSDPPRQDNAPDEAASAAQTQEPCVAQAEGGESDESIDDYMAQLLQRIGGKPSARVVPSRPAAPAAQPRQAPLEAPRAANKAPEMKRPEHHELLTELPTRSVVPAERAANMSAMRELAQIHSRSLLDIHFRRRFLRASVGQILVIAVGLVAGTAFMLVARHVPLALFPGVIGYAVAIVWGTQYLGALYQVLRGRRNARSAASVKGTPAGGIPDSQRVIVTGLDTAPTPSAPEPEEMPLGVEE